MRQPEAVENRANARRAVRNTEASFDELSDAPSGERGSRARQCSIDDERDTRQRNAPLFHPRTRSERRTAPGVPRPDPLPNGFASYSKTTCDFCLGCPAGDHADRTQPSGLEVSRQRVHWGTGHGVIRTRRSRVRIRAVIGKVGAMVIEHATLDLVAILGYGRFGRALGGLLSEAGIAHRAYDPHLPSPSDGTHAIAPEYRAESLASLVRGASFVALAVPVTQMRRALVELRPYVEAARPQPIVLDVGSVKVGPSAALADVMGRAIPWCATHPLFGPSSLALAERPLRVVVCPAPDEYGHAAATARVRDLYRRIGCEVIEQTPESHDRVMAHTHALTFFIAKGMIDAGAGMDVPFAPPSFQAMARAIETVRSDAGHLFAAIARDNPFAAEARKQLVQALSTIDRALDEAVGHGMATESRGRDSASPAEQAGADSPDTARFAIPDLGQRSPELKEARDHIDEVDREIVRLLAQRAQLSQRAAQAKAKLGAPVLDGAREAEVIGARRAWASELKLDAEAATDVFRAIMTMSRRAQRTY